VGLALRNGARAVLVNRGETPYDEAVSLLVHAGIGEVLPAAVERVRQHLGADASLRENHKN
jgi:NAD-dependent SIR2 family protein deacetylase